MPTSFSSEKRSQVQQISIDGQSIYVEVSSASVTQVTTS